jgi:prepilin-type N-terminal cleavage/methylation domain-containing protein
MKNNQKGFTLIEMLVVVAIVGLLSSVVVVGVGGARQKARDTKRVADMRSTQTWAEANYISAYPDAATWTAWSGKPIDPLNSGTNVYTYAQCGTQSYIAHALLEEGDNRPAGGLTSLPTECAGSGVTCDSAANYCVGPSS